MKDLKLNELLAIEPTTELEKELMRRLAIVPKLASNVKRYQELFEEFSEHPLVKEGIELAQRKYEQQAKQRSRRQL